MNQFLLILLFLVVCAGFYMDKQQPEEWNKILDSLMAPGAAGAPASNSSTATAAINTNAAPVPAAPIYVNPDSKAYTHSSHIIDVEQPSQVTAKVYVPPNPLPSSPNWVWTTTDGRTFKSVVIEKVEADQVTIYHQDGTAVIDINLLPSEIETQLNYDPTLAAAAHLAREQAANDAAAASAVPAASTSMPVAPAH
jgi:hypothetical protein